MSIVLWALVALVAGAAFLTLNARRALARRPPLELPPGEALGSTVLERLAARCLVGGLALTAAAGGSVAWVGPEVFYSNDRVRIVVTLLLLAALGVLAGFAFRASTWIRRTRSPLDERDRAILEAAPRLEGGAMLVTLACWVVGLQQAFWSARAVPMVYLYLVFWSLLMVKVLALPIGVLVGYRRS